MGGQVVSLQDRVLVVVEVGLMARTEEVEMGRAVAEMAEVIPGAG